jgi:hypothetical protein
LLRHFSHLQVHSIFVYFELDMFLSLCCGKVGEAVVEELAVKCSIGSEPDTPQPPLDRHSNLVKSQHRSMFSASVTRASTSVGTPQLIQQRNCPKSSQPALTETLARKIKHLLELRASSPSYSSARWKMQQTTTIGTR